MDRRRYLAIVGAGASLSGCLGFDFGTSEDANGSSNSPTRSTATPQRPPQDNQPSITEGGGNTDSGGARFQVVEIQAVSTVSVGEQLPIRITVKNTGTASGSFEGSATVRKMSKTTQQTVSTDTIQPGQSTTREITITPQTAGEYSISVADFSGGTTVRVAARTIRAKKAFTTSGGLQIDIEDIVFRTAYFTGSQASPGIERANQAQFAFVKIATEATSGSIELPSRHSFKLAGTEPARSMRIPQADIGEPYSDTEPTETIESGGRRSGWLVYQLPSNPPTEMFAWARNDDDVPDVEWTFFGSTTNRITNPPQFEVTDTNAPETVQAWDGEDTVSMTVRNSGGVTGTFRAILEQQRGEYAKRWESRERVTRRIEGGTSETIEANVSSKNLGDYAIRFHPYASASIRFIPIQEQLGQAYTVRDTFRLRPHSLTLANSYEHASQYLDGEEAGAGEQFAFVGIEADAVASSNGRFPSQTDFKLTTAEVTFTPEIDFDAYSSPVEGDVYQTPTSFDSGSTASGYLRFTIDSNLAESDLVFRYAPIQTSNKVVEWK